MLGSCRLVHRVACRLVRPYTQNSVSALREALELPWRPETLNQWTSALKECPEETLKLRYKMYENVRRAHCSSLDLLDFACVLGEKNTLLADYDFILEMLVALKDKTLLFTTFQRLAKSNPIFAEQALRSRINALLDKDMDLVVELFTFVYVWLGRNLAEIQEPASSLLRLISSKGGFYQALERFTLSNPVLSGPLITSVFIVRYSTQDVDLLNKLWALKMGLGLSSIDLHRRMLFLLKVKQPRKALEAYNSHPDLHADFQIDALLLAAARLKDMELVQSTFERLATAQDTKKVFSNKHYAILLQAMANMGQTDALDEIYKGICKKRAPSRAVFHALIYGYAVLGRKAEARKYFNLMTDGFHIEPRRSTFRLLLIAYRDARDHVGAMNLVKLMVGEHHLPLTNYELTQLVSLCAKRRDLETGQSIWKWALSLGIKPDRISSNTLLELFAQCDALDKAFEHANSMRHSQVAIDTLTVLMSAVARYGDRDTFARLINLKTKLKLVPDFHWFAAVLSYQVRIANLPGALKTFDAMVAARITPTAGIYGLLIELYTKKHNYRKATEMYEKAKALNLADSKDIQTKYIRMMTVASKRDTLDADKLVQEVISKGHFDPTSETVPRDQVPPALIEKIVRQHIKRNRPHFAQTLLAAFIQQQQIPEPWKVTALSMETHYALGNYNILGRLWDKFLRDLRATFVPFKDTASNTMVNRLPARYRHDYYREINIQMRYMAHKHQFQRLFTFPKYVQALGLEFNQSNWNLLITLLIESSTGKKLETEILKHAFSVANDLSKNYILRGIRRSLKFSAGPEQHERLKIESSPGLSRSLVFKLGQMVPRVIASIAKAENIDQETAGYNVSIEYPQLMKVLRRSKQI